MKVGYSPEIKWEEVALKMVKKNLGNSNSIKFPLQKVNKAELNSKVGQKSGKVILENKKS